ncbi:hypothetical protein QWY28_17445 [Nocardioides sp. SOB77]|uniref:Alpha/beta fold hydrolase n=1 Tax=Nocardioides oceani TaxID=3058369 RepID=A0ABT8FJX7_9ACTN|nr:hypothetical protein [Nocardioides oceani]MDN4174750.1 hypothetical protein [Nocardioides oceani]
MTLGTQGAEVSYIDDASGVQAMRYWLPPSDRLGEPRPLVVYCHQAGGNHQINPTYWAYPLIHAAVQEGWIVAASNLHGDGWGNATQMSDIAALVAQISAINPVSKVLLAGASMGGLSCANCHGRDVLAAGLIRGVYVIDAVLDLNWAYQQTAYRASINTAYAVTASTLTGAVAVGATSLPTAGAFPVVGTQLQVGAGTANVETVITTGASNGTSVAVTATTKTHASGDAVSDFPTKSAGFDPMQRPISDLTDVRWRFLASTADTNVLKSANTDPFAARIAAAPEEGVVTHNSSTHTQVSYPADFIAFAKRCGL